MDFTSLSNAFRKFGVHTPSCNQFTRTATKCSCGFTAALLALPVNTNEPCGTPSVANPDEARPAYNALPPRT